MLGLFSGLTVLLEVLGFFFNFVFKEIKYTLCILEDVMGQREEADASLTEPLEP